MEGGVKTMLAIKKLGQSFEEERAINFFKVATKIFSFLLKFLNQFKNQFQKRIKVYHE